MVQWGTKRTAKSPRDGMNGFDDSRSLWGKVVATAQPLGHLAQQVILARGRLRILDYAALGVSATRAGVEIHSIWSRETVVNLTPYFDHPGSEWKIAPYFVSRVAFENLEIHEKIVETHKVVKGGKITQAAWTATVDGVEIGWVGEPAEETVPEYIWSKTPEKIRHIAARRLWEKAGADNILRIQGEKTFPHFLPTDIVETNFLRMMQARVSKFLDKNVAWSIIMDGQPGTGKSVAVGYIAKKLGFKTVIVGAEDFCQRFQDRDGVSAHGVQLAEILRPDILIVNDIDRVTLEDQLRLLEIFDNAKSYARLIFATTNHYRKLLEPVRRPGRLDDLITVPGLSLEEVKQIAPGLIAHAERMVDWPIAYVRNMQERFIVLGDTAIDEFDTVARRLEEIRKDGKYPSSKAAPEKVEKPTKALPAKVVQVEKTVEPENMPSSILEAQMTPIEKFKWTGVGEAGILKSGTTEVFERKLAVGFGESGRCVSTTFAGGTLSHLKYNDDGSKSAIYMREVAEGTESVEVGSLIDETAEEKHVDAAESLELEETAPLAAAIPLEHEAGQPIKSRVGIWSLAKITDGLASYSLDVDGHEKYDRAILDIADSSHPLMQSVAATYPLGLVDAYRRNMAKREAARAAVERDEQEDAEVDEEIVEPSNEEVDAKIWTAQDHEDFCEHFTRMAEDVELGVKTRVLADVLPDGTNYYEFVNVSGADDETNQTETYNDEPELDFEYERAKEDAELKLRRFKNATKGWDLGTHAHTVTPDGYTEIVAISGADDKETV